MQISTFTKSSIMLLATLLLLVSPGLLYAQTQPIINSTLDEQVIDARTRQPLARAVVAIEGTTHAVSTDVEGNSVLLQAKISLHLANSVYKL